jgi:hypothetical protein
MMRSRLGSLPPLPGRALSQRMQRPDKLGYAVTGEGAWMVDVGDDP